jgi:DNA mismatch endonuclease, patch repair protein
VADTRTPEQRRRIMQSVGTANTGPELTVRRLLHRRGYRYRLHPKQLPGRPDVVFPGRRRAIFVHGCFWHNHGCSKGQAPKSKLDFWGPKLAANKERDARNEAALRALGWEVLTVWQCETSDAAELETTLTTFLGPPGKSDRQDVPTGIGSREKVEIAA